MAVTMSYNGKSNESFLYGGRKYLHLATKPELHPTSENVEYITVPGRPGILTVRDGTYPPIEISVTFTARLPFTNNVFSAQIDSIVTWLLGTPSEGNDRLRFSWLAYEYKVLNVNVDNIFKVSPHIWQIDVTFTCEHSAYYYTGVTTTYDVTTSSPTRISNTRPTCYPFFDFYVTSAGAIQIERYSEREGYKYFDLTLTTTGHIYVDSEKMITYRVSGSRKYNLSSSVRGDYMDLWMWPGYNTYKLIKPSNSSVSTTLTMDTRARASV